MKILASLADLRRSLSALPRPLGLVPTMGYLHQGHLSLVEAAKEQCASVVVSIFVNPAQFGPGEDLVSYPRDLIHDEKLLRAAGADLVWTPSPDSIYPPGYQTWVSVEDIAQRLEGAMRPGHFRGVATIVAKLFNAVQPDLAYFGQKDAQQVVIIRQMVRDLNFPVEIIVCPIQRESDGLAMSSRNIYLSPVERQSARVLSRALSAAQSAYEAGERRSARLCQVMLDILNSEPLASIQYVSCAHPDTLIEFDSDIREHCLLSMAVYIGKTRLIDNLLLGDERYRIRLAGS